MFQDVLPLPSSGGNGRLQVVSAASFCRRPAPSSEAELLGPVVVRGSRTLIGGPTGEGKTSIALQLTRAVCAGEWFLDWRGAGGCRALIVDLEQCERTLRRRLHEFRLHEGVDVDLVRAPEGLALDQSEDDVAELERIFDEGGYDLVLIDPLYKLHQGDSMDERAAVDLMRQLDRFRTEFGFALVLCVHCRKPYQRTRPSVHDIFGSSAYVRGAEVVLGIHRVGNGSARIYFHKDRDGDLPVGECWPLSFDHERGFERHLGPATSKLNEQVAELLRAKPSLLTKKDLAAATGKKVRTIENALRALGACSQSKPGSREHMYALPEALADESELAEAA